MSERDMDIGLAQTTHCMNSSHTQSRRAENHGCNTLAYVAGPRNPNGHTYLLAVLFSPGKDAAGSLTHDLLEILSVDPPCLGAVLIAIFEVDAMLPQEVPSLLLIV
jgi:hypothetical protein